MKALRKLLLTLLMIVVLAVCCGCVQGGKGLATLETKAPTTTMDPILQEYKKNPSAYVEFTRSTEPRYAYMPVEELLRYESQYPDCNGTWFRDRLSGEDLLIYNCYLFAMENRYIYFDVYVEDSDKDFSYIREALSLDSPFLEQNYSHYENVWKNPVNYIGESIAVSMEQFTGSRWEMKMDALWQCRKIVADMPAECVTQQQKMEYLYDYVCEHVEYVKYESMADESYFYDAVCNGKTVCDGYSNMLSLLFRLIGVECVEAMGRDADGEDGHTWVVAKLDGVFYNFDPTFEDTDEVDTGDRRYFGFSDDLAAVKNLDWEEQRPKCIDTSRDFPYADMVVKSITDRSEVQKIAKLTQQRAKNGKTTTVIAVRGIVDETTYKKFVNRYGEYVTKIKAIEATAEFMRNSTLLEITVTPR